MILPWAFRNAPGLSGRLATLAQFATGELLGRVLVHAAERPDCDTGTVCAIHAGVGTSLLLAAIALVSCDDPPVAAGRSAGTNRNPLAWQ